jgi:hypothetical protein
MDTEIQVMIIEVPNLFAFLGFNFSSHISAQVEIAVYVEGMGSSLFLVGLQLRGIIPMRFCSACFPFNPKNSRRTTIITDTPCCCGQKPVQTLSWTLFCYLEPWCQLVQTNLNSKLESPFLWPPQSDDWLASHQFYELMIMTFLTTELAQLWAFAHVTVKPTI